MASQPGLESFGCFRPPLQMSERQAAIQFEIGIFAGRFVNRADDFVPASRVVQFCNLGFSVSRGGIALRKRGRGVEKQKSQQENQSAARGTANNVQLRV